MKRSKSSFSFGSEQDLEKPTTSKGSAESMQTQYGDEFKFSEDHGKAKSLEHLEQEHSQPKDSSSATLNTTSPPTSSKASGVSIKRTIFVKKIRRSVSYFELIGLSSPELSRSSTKEDKRYEIEETKILPIPKTETGIKNSLQPSDKQLENSQSTGTSLSITAEQKSYTEPVIVKQPAVEENKSSQQGTSSTSSPETRLDIYKNFFMRPSVIQKTTSLYASITGREESRTSIEPEFSKSREAEGTKSSTEPKFVKSHEVEKIKISTVPGFGKRPQAERTKISNEPEFVKRREIERTKSSTEPEFVKRYEIQRSKSSTEPVFVKSHETDRPESYTKPEFVKHREVEKSKRSTEPVFIKSHEAERPKSSTEPEFVKRYEIQRSKSSTEPVFVKSHETERPKSSTKPEFVKHHEVEKSKSSTEPVFIKSHEAESPKSSTEPEFVKRYEIQRSKSSTEPVFVKSREIERAKSFTEPGFIKRREFKGLKSSQQPSDRQSIGTHSTVSPGTSFDNSQSPGTNFFVTAEQKSYIEPVNVKQPTVEENKDSQQGTSSTSSPGTGFDIFENFFKRPSVIQKTSSFSPYKSASITGREESRTSIEPEFAKSREVEGTKSSTEPKFVKSHEVEKIKISTVPGFGKRPQAERTKISNEPEFVKRREIERTKSSTEPEFVKRYEIQRSKSSTEPVFVKSHETDRPESSTKPEFVKHREVEKSKRSTEPVFIKSHEAESPKSSTEPEFVKRYEIQRSKSSTEPVFVKSREIERVKSFTEPGFIKRREFKDLKSYQQPSDRQSTGTHSTVSPGTSFDTQEKYYRRPSVIRKAEPSFTPRKSASFSGCTETTTSTEPEFIKPPEIAMPNEPVFLKRREIKAVKGSTESELIKRPEIEVGKSSTEPEPVKRRETKELKTSTEPELFKHNEIEVPTSSQQPTDKQYSRSSSKLSFDIFQSFIKNAPLFERLTSSIKFYKPDSSSSGEAGSSTKHEDLKRSDKETKSSQQPTSDKELIGAFSTSRPERDLKHSKSFEGSSYVTDEQRRSIAVYSPDSFSRSEDTKSSSDEDDIFAEVD